MTFKYFFVSRSGILKHNNEKFAIMSDTNITEATLKLEMGAFYDPIDFIHFVSNIPASGTRFTKNEDDRYVYINTKDAKFSHNVEWPGFKRFLRFSTFRHDTVYIDNQMTTFQFVPDNSDEWRYCKRKIKKKFRTMVSIIMALVSIPVIVKLLTHFYQQPDYVEQVQKISYVTKNATEISNNIIQNTQKQMEINKKIEAREKRRAALKQVTRQVY